MSFFRGSGATRSASLRTPPAAAVFAGLTMAVIAAAATGIFTGAANISPAQVFTAFAGADAGDPEVATILERRLPRTLLGLTAGASMGLAGALLQNVTRNPLADTGVLGINSGAAFAAALGMAVFGVSAPAGFLGLAIGGATITGAAVYAIGRGGAVGVDPLRLVLAGVALGAILEGIGDGLALVDPHTFDRVRGWMVGNLDVASPDPARLAFIGLAAGLVLAFPVMRSLDHLRLDDDTASSLGVPLRRLRFFLLAAVIVFAASATAAAGVMVFVGLMVPQLARALVGAKEGRILAASALLGPVVLVTADVLGRQLVPGELPAGVVVSFIGAPFLIAIARRPVMSP
ncbi:FecCD family ABC transporter permease [Corynebacterium freneyi]|uniref:FecCD family ABC transporter permease n=1 Tax=Corynebacterium freneyi TaxID=134034 RepID=UPI00396CDF43